jgi:FAD/FMN-containing dehydrogenase
LSAADTFSDRRTRLAAALAARAGPLRVKKRATTNLFRYATRPGPRGDIDLGGFNHVLELDRAARTLEVEGLATYEAIVDRTLGHGLVPLITPELKHITIGGATVGIGIESNGFRHGFVHDGLLEAEVLLADGRIVVCTPDNEHADLFRALPNSYGTLGYILRAKIRLMPAAARVHLHTSRFTDPGSFLAAMRAAIERADVDFIESLMFAHDALFLTLARFVDRAPATADIVHEHVFYKLIAREGDVYLTTRDYLFRYDPDWFWNIPETAPYRLFRRFAPVSMRNSGFYKRYTLLKRRLLGALPQQPQGEEPLIQDWEVPWEHAGELLRCALDNADLGGKPWIATPIRALSSPTLYPVRPGTLYFNLGCYCHVKKRPGEGDYFHTRLLDRKCFELGGIKMLYSSTFLDEPEFDRIYNGAGYRAIKRKYDPDSALGTLYQKCVVRQ